MLDLYILKSLPSPSFSFHLGENGHLLLLGRVWEAAFNITSLQLCLWMFTESKDVCFLLADPHTSGCRVRFYDEASPIQPQYHRIQTSPLNFCPQGSNFISSQLHTLHNTIYKSAAKLILNSWLSLELLNPIMLFLAVSCYTLHAGLGPLFLKMLHKYETYILMWM